MVWRRLYWLIGRLIPRARNRTYSETAGAASTSEFKLTRRARSARFKAEPARRIPSQRYRSIWLWLVVAVFAIFAIRSFCNVLFVDGNELKIQSPNNLGDLSLHLAYINNFASGVALWPDNPIYVFSKLRYPAGIDLFNAILVCLGMDVIRGLVWTGLLASAALCFALFAGAARSPSPGSSSMADWPAFNSSRAFKWLDYQGVPFIGWKSLALAMLVTQRGLLYALPVGLLLLYHWRAKFFPRGLTASGVAAPARPAPSVLAGALALRHHAALPRSHLHGAQRGSGVPVSFPVANVSARKQLAFLAIAAFLPATFFVWLVTDHFHAGSVLQWNPGWVQNNGDFARPLAAFAQPGRSTGRRASVRFPWDAETFRPVLVYQLRHHHSA